MEKNRKKIAATSLLLIAAFGFLALSSVHADDDEAEEHEDGEEYAVPSSEAVSVQEESVKTERRVVTDPPQIIWENQVQTVMVPDQDRDGLVDSEDPHPAIAEIYIAKDDNLNGIVDSWEVN